MQQIPKSKLKEMSPIVKNVKNSELNIVVHIEFVILVISSPISLQFNPARSPSVGSVIDEVV